MKKRDLINKFKDELNIKNTINSKEFNVRILKKITKINKSRKSNLDFIKNNRINLDFFLNKNKKLFKIKEIVISNNGLISTNNRNMKRSIHIKGDVDENFWISIGLLIGEMYKSIKGEGYRSFSFSNNRKETIIKILNFLKSFDIDKDRLKYYITVGKQQEIDSRIYWSKHLKLNPNRLKITKSNKNISFPTPCTISYHSGLLKYILLSIIDDVESSELNKFQAIGIIKGLLASEGSVILKNGKLEHVALENLDIKVLALYIYCLDKIGIDWKISYIKVFTRGWENVLKIKSNGLLEENHKSYIRFLYGFEKLKENELIYHLKDTEDKFYLKDIFKLLDLKTTQNILRRLRHFEKLGLLQIYGNGTKKEPFYFIKTDKCFDIIKLLINVKKDLKRFNAIEQNVFERIEKKIKEQRSSEYKIKNRDKIFLEALENNTWYTLKEIIDKVPYQRGYVNTVMPWMERKGLVEKRFIDRIALYKIKTT